VYPVAQSGEVFGGYRFPMPRRYARAGPTPASRCLVIEADPRYQRNRDVRWPWVATSACPPILGVSRHPSHDCFRSWGRLGADNRLGDGAVASGLPDRMTPSVRHQQSEGRASGGRFSGEAGALIGWSRTTASGR
jgi:hypothetical protein